MGRKRGRHGAEQAVGKSAATARANDNQVDFAGHVDKNPRGIAGLNEAVNFRRTNFLCQINTLLNDLRRTFFKSCIVEDRISAI